MRRLGISKKAAQRAVEAAVERIKLRRALERPDLYNEQGGLRGFEGFEEFIDEEEPSKYEPDDRPVGYDD